VSASYGGIDSNLVEYRAFIIKNLPAGEVVTYQTSGNNWFVISAPRAATFSMSDTCCRTAAK
jgi:hypothetical protein